MSKYQNALKLSHRMTKSILFKRPNCEEILDSKHLWALDKNELTINDDLKHVIEQKSKDKQSIYHIIYAKFNFQIC
jgi:hypothetical protein